MHMSLTRNEWIEMWELIKIIENEWEEDTQPNTKAIFRIKELIQQVIGQME